MTPTKLLVVGSILMFCAGGATVAAIAAWIESISDPAPIWAAAITLFIGAVAALLGVPTP